MISDIHEDIVELSSALRRLEQRNVDEIVCLGDIVGFSVPFYAHLKSRDANGVISLLRSNCSIVVTGNHDLYWARKIPQHRSFFPYPEDWYSLDFAERKRRADGKIFLYEDNELSPLLSRSSLDYLSELPEFVIKDCGDHRLLFTHYAFPDCTGCATAVVSCGLSLVEHFSFMEANGCLYAFSGNDHIEGARVVTREVNQPCRFGDFKLTQELTWINGPAVCRGTTDNGIFLYDSATRTLMVERLDATKYVVPDCY